MVQNGKKITRHFNLGQSEYKNHLKYIYNILATLHMTTNSKPFFLHTNYYKIYYYTSYRVLFITTLKTWHINPYYFLITFIVRVQTFETRLLLFYNIKSIHILPTSQTHFKENCFLKNPLSYINKFFGNTFILIYFTFCDIYIYS